MCVCFVCGKVDCVYQCLGVSLFRGTHAPSPPKYLYVGPCRETLLDQLRIMSTSLCVLTGGWESNR